MALRMLASLPHAPGDPAQRCVAAWLSCSLMHVLCSQLHVLMQA